MRRAVPVVFLIVLTLFTISCGQLAEIFEDVGSAISDSGTSDTSDDTGDKPTDSNQPPPEDPPPSDPPPAAPPASCDPPAESLALNTSHNLQMHNSAGQSYPANCLYYCVQIPAPGNSRIPSEGGFPGV